MIAKRILKKKPKKMELFVPPEDKYAMILIINDIQSHDWYENLKKGENIYATHEIRFAYPTMPTYIYLTSCKGIAADAKVGSDDDFDRIRESGIIDVDWGTPLINFREIDGDDSISKDDLIEMGFFKKVPIILKYITKTEYETIESLFED